MARPYSVSLTSVPPRFGRLGPVLRALLAQDPAPQAVFLCLARAYPRFPGPVPAPEFPEGVTVLQAGEDIGPGLKLCGALAAVRTPRLIYCDDDWIAAPGWSAALLEAQSGTAAVCGQGYSVARLQRQSGAGPGQCDIVQGFSGVLVAPAWFDGLEVPEDPALRAVDDIWLSAHLAAQGIARHVVPAARACLRPVADDAHGLQDAVIGGMDRAAANRACAAAMARRYGIWPKSTRAARVR